MLPLSKSIPNNTTAGGREVFELPDSGCVQVRGADAEKVVNNLCTNDIKKLAISSCCEAFITNVRGWCVEHAFVLKLENEILLIGQFGNPQALCAHIDRYIIREDAKVSDLSGERRVLLLSGEVAAVCAQRFGSASLHPGPGRTAFGEIASCSILAASVQMLTANDVLWIVDSKNSSAVIDAVRVNAVSLGTADTFELQRIASFWPRSGREILDKTLPQELDRDLTAVSFTKGCYLGQETIARLDAIGQLQKKLCLIRIEIDHGIQAGTSILREDQAIGQVTSIAYSHENGHAYALAYLRRGNFSAGLELTCNGAKAIVLQR